MILLKSNFSSRVNMLCQKNKERWAAYLVLFVIMHDVGILYNVVLVFGFVNEIISVTVLNK